MAEIHIDDKAVAEMLASAQAVKFLDMLGHIITAHAVPHSGVDTGRLIASMGHRVNVGDDGVPVLTVGSNASENIHSVYYALPHWGGVTDEHHAAKAAQAAEPSRKRVPHSTTEAPATPYTKAFAEIGIPGPALTPDGVEI